jgi:hypothetical protein
MCCRFPRRFLLPIPTESVLKDAIEEMAMETGVIIMTSDP